MDAQKLAALNRMLGHKDSSVVLQGLRLLNGLGDPRYRAALLGGVRLSTSHQFTLSDGRYIPSSALLALCAGLEPDADVHPSLLRPKEIMIRLLPAFLGAIEQTGNLCDLDTLTIRDWPAGEDLDLSRLQGMKRVLFWGGEHSRSSTVPFPRLSAVPGSLDGLALTSRFSFAEDSLPRDFRLRLRTLKIANQATVPELGDLPGLEELKLENLSIGNVSIPRPLLRRLKSLTVRHCYGIDLSMLQDCKQLRHLQVRTSARGEVSRDLFSSLRRLETLTVDWSPADIPQLPAGAKLRHLSITASGLLTAALAKRYPHLQSLSVQNIDSFRSLRALTKLRSLKVHTPPLKASRKPLELPALKQCLLTLAGDAERSVRLPFDAQTAPALRHLTLVGDDDVHLNLDELPGLDELVVRKLGVEDVSFLGAQRPKSLTILGCPRLRTLDGLSPALIRSLRSLRIGQCHDFTEMDALCAAPAKRLQALFLDRNPDLAAVPAFSAPQLHTLRIQECRSLSDIAVSAPRLRHVNFSMLPALRGLSWKDVGERLSSVSLVHVGLESFRGFENASSNERSCEHVPKRISADSKRVLSRKRR